MRNPNGFGSVDKLSGNRRRPYRVRITSGYEQDEDGHTRQIQRTLGTYATYQEAVDALAAYNKNPVILDPSVTFGEVYRRWAAEKYPTASKSTASTYTSAYSAISDYLGNMEFAKLRRAHLQEAVELSGREYPTLQMILVVIRSVYKYALKNDIIDKDYSQYLDISKFKPGDDGEPMHKAFTEDELSVMWNHREDPFVREILIRGEVNRVQELFQKNFSGVEKGPRRIPRRPLICCQSASMTLTSLTRSICLLWR